MLPLLPSAKQPVQTKIVIERRLRDSDMVKGLINTVVELVDGRVPTEYVNVWIDPVYAGARVKISAKGDQSLDGVVSRLNTLVGKNEFSARVNDKGYCEITLTYPGSYSVLQRNVVHSVNVNRKPEPTKVVLNQKVLQVVNRHRTTVGKKAIAMPTLIRYYKGQQRNVDLKLKPSDKSYYKNGRDEYELLLSSK